MCQLKVRSDSIRIHLYTDLEQPQQFCLALLVNETPKGQGGPLDGRRCPRDNSPVNPCSGFPICSTVAAVSTGEGIEALSHGFAATDLTALVGPHHDAAPF